jgi:hypothetical protein
VPLFHFDVQYGQEPWSYDESGTELDSEDEVRNQAFDLISMLVRDKLRNHTEIAVRVRDGWPAPIQTLRLSLQAEGRD